MDRLLTEELINEIIEEQRRFSLLKGPYGKGDEKAFAKHAALGEPVEPGAMQPCQINLFTEKGEVYPNVRLIKCEHKEVQFSYIFPSIDTGELWFVETVIPIASIYKVAKHTCIGKKSDTVPYIQQELEIDEDDDDDYLDYGFNKKR